MVHIKKYIEDMIIMKGEKLHGMKLNYQIIQMGKN